MPGKYPVEMLSRKFGEPSHEIRRALMDAGVEIDLADEVEVDAAEKADSKIKKFLDDHNKARMEAKNAGAAHDADKAKWIEAHNKKVAADLEKHGGWEGAVAAGPSSSESDSE